jgi:hypothetical protein
MSVLEKYIHIYKLNNVRTRIFSEYVRDQFENDPISEIGPRGKKDLISINELGFITLDSQNGAYVIEKGDRTLNQSRRIIQQRAYVIGLIPKALYSVFIKHLENKHPEIIKGFFGSNEFIYLDLENNIEEYEGFDYDKETVEESERDTPIRVENYHDVSKKNKLLYNKNLINTINENLDKVKNEWMTLHLADSRWNFDVSKDGGLFDAIIHCLELSHSEIDSQLRGGKYKTKTK